VVHKPFKPEELVSSVRQVLDGETDAKENHGATSLSGENIAVQS
jgi:DNA-binding response OmpR family regulator